MSFGWILCIYGIGWLVTLVVATCVTVSYLYRKYRTCCWFLIDEIGAEDLDMSWTFCLVDSLCSVLLWPVMIPRNAIRVIHIVEKIAKEYGL